MLCAAALVMPPPVVAGERLFNENFSRPDSLVIGNGWRELMGGGECTPTGSKAGQKHSLFFNEGSGINAGINQGINPLQREIDQALLDSRRRASTSSIPP